MGLEIHMGTEVSDKKQLQVLIVDDNQAMSKLIKSNLEGVDIKVTEATSGLECMNMLFHIKVDLILLDLKLPDFNGWGILSLLRLTDPFRRMPVIIISGESPDKGLINQFRPDDYIQKPFDVRNLLERVRIVLDLTNMSRYLGSEIAS